MGGKSVLVCFDVTFEGILRRGQGVMYYSTGAHCVITDIAPCTWACFYPITGGENMSRAKHHQSDSTLAVSRYTNPPQSPYVSMTYPHGKACYRAAKHTFIEWCGEFGIIPLRRII